VEDTRSRLSSTRLRLAVAAGLLVLALAGLAASTGPGITWDEPTYVAAGYTYCLWFQTLSPGAFSQDNIDRFWGRNAEHPPAAKLVYGL
jgi:hypothetical protein